MSTRSRPGSARGFTLIEVLVSIVIIGVGLLGIAKMQALAFSSTGVASMRSLAAIEASSLAAAMHGDRAYWASGVAPATFTIAGTTISDPTLSGQAQVCTTTSTTPADCAPLALAAWDLRQWATAVNNLLPNAVTTISCTNNVGTSINCTISMTWAENMVAVNAQGNNLAGMNLPTYNLYVEP